MAVRGGKALVVAMLISFLLVQGSLGDLHSCFCRCYKRCMKQTRNHDVCVVNCMDTPAKCFFGCLRSTPSVMALDDDLVNPVTDERSMAVPAGGADHGEFHITEGSVEAPTGGADHGKFNVAEEDAAP
uniref:Jekyll 1 n=1 Tax=Triticum monococcum subsp. aegilopoides TaxID=52163 RepID=A0A4Y5PW35_TRIMO|nr:jekyll 1 [Triticum monococcum subsp. aegilopoides]